MHLPDGYFHNRSPADIVAKVAIITLANISLMGDKELERIGWIGNLIVERLYELTSAGVWIARTDASGRVTEANSATINTSLSPLSYIQRATISGVPETVAAINIADSEATQTNRHRRIVTVPLLSNAGGGFDADQALTGVVAAGYYKVAKLLALMSIDAAAPSTVGLYFSTTTHNKFRLITISTTGDAVPNTDLAGIPIYYVDDDGENISLDVDCTGFGNAKNWIAVVEYWAET